MRDTVPRDLPGRQQPKENWHTVDVGDETFQESQWNRDVKALTVISLDDWGKTG